MCACGSLSFLCFSGRVCVFVFLSFFLSFSLSLSLSVSVCGAKEVDKGRVPGLAKKVVFAASTPTALSAVGVTGKVGVVADGVWSEVAVDGFPVQLVSVSSSFAALCISALDVRVCAPLRKMPLLATLL